MSQENPHIVIVGGGFAGMYAAKILGAKRFAVTVVDKNNYHLFQPLLYQVATGFLSPGDIAAPLRSILAKRQTVRVIQDEVTDIDITAKSLTLKNGTLTYDYLIVATGVTHSYFGNDSWEYSAPGLKTVEDALEIRRRALSAFERAERTDSLSERKKLLRFVIVGGGPTGVELAGALGELAQNTLKGEFRNIEPREAEIILLEGGKRILSSFHEKTSKYAAKQLSKLGVHVKTDTFVKNLEGDTLHLEMNEERSQLEAGTILWAAGVKASPLANALTREPAESTDKIGRVRVTKELTLQNHPEVFVIGDLAAVFTEDGKEVPGVAPAAIQEGEYAAKAIIRRETGKEVKPFKYFDKGSMAVIGRGHAVAETWKLRLWGFPGWAAWAFIHIYFLIEFENKFVVFFQWAWNYLTDQRGTRLITEAK